MLKGLEGFPYVKDRIYIYVGETLKWAIKAKKLTSSNDLNLLLKEQEKKNILLGDLYGYPKCCSKYFIKNKYKFKRYSPYQKFFTKINNKLVELALLHQPCSKNCLNSQRIKKNNNQSNKEI
jgi:oligoendopeptidase F